MTRAPRPRARPATRAFVLACLGLALAGCATQEPRDDEPGLAVQAGEQREVLQPAPEPERPMQNNGDRALPPEDLLAPVLADAAGRTGLPAEKLVVKGAWRRTWSDGSLGCPQPGMYYTQALVPGWQVILRAGERTLDYRLSDRGVFFPCEDGELTNGR
jgi:hypothetical protein